MNQIRTILYLGALSALLIGLGSLAGREAAIAAALFAVVLGASAYFASDRLVLAMPGARELGPNEAPSLQGTVKKLAETAEVPAPRMFVIRSPHALAIVAPPQVGEGAA